MPDTNRKPLSPNQQRIMDVLLEDALKAPAPLPAPGRRLAPRPRRKIWAGVAVTVACLVVVALAVGYVLTRPPVAPANTPVLASNTPVITPRVDPRPRPDTGNQAGPQPQPEPLPQPEPGPEPKPEPAPESAPESAPVKPPEQVENPPQPQPTPSPAPEATPETEPGSAVESPRGPEETGANTPAAKPRVQVIAVNPRADWKISLDGGVWNTPESSQWLPGECRLRCKRAVDLNAGGVLLRIQGEVSIHLTDGKLELKLHNDKLFLDSRGANLPVHIGIGEHELRTATGAALLDRNAVNTFIVVYDGLLQCGERTVAEGRQAFLGKQGLSVDSPHKAEMKDNEFLRGLASRVVYSERFTGEPKGRLREGEIVDGVLAGATVFWGYPADIRCEAGQVLRLRVRFHNATGATVTQFSRSRNDNFSHELPAVKHNEWVILELPVSAFLDRGTHKLHPDETDWFQNLSIQPKGQGARVEVDWIEIIAAVGKK